MSLRVDGLESSIVQQSCIEKQGLSKFNNLYFWATIKHSWWEYIFNILVVCHTRKSEKAFESIPMVNRHSKLHSTWSLLSIDTRVGFIYTSMRVHHGEYITSGNQRCSSTAYRIKHAYGFSVLYRVSVVYYGTDLLLVPLLLVLLNCIPAWTRNRNWWNYFSIHKH